MLTADVAENLPGTGGWLYAGEGPPPAPDSVAYLWRRTRAAAGIDTMRPHDHLRHFYTSGKALS